MRRAVPLLLAALLAAAPAAGEPLQRPLGVGDTALAVQVFGRDGSVFRLEDHRGRVVLLDFWASWCAPCLQSMPAYDALHERLHDQGLTVVGISVDHDRRAALRMLDRVDVSFAIAFDPMNHWSQRFRLPGMPTAYVIDREGVIRHVYMGFSDEYMPTLEAFIRDLLDASPPEP